MPPNNRPQDRPSPQQPAGQTYGQPWQPPSPYGQVQQAHHSVYANEYGFHGQPHASSSYEQATPPRRKKRGLLVAIVALILLAGMGGGAYAAYMAGQPTPDKVFRRSLEVSMSSQSMAQNISSKGSSIDYKFDFSDVTKPKMSCVGVMAIDGLGDLKLSAAGYDDAVSSYARLAYESGGKTAGVLGTKDSPWVQIRENGQLPASYTDNGNDLRVVVDELADGHIGVHGDFIMGNFSQQDRQMFVDETLATNVYTYDPKRVTKEILDGKQVFKYEVKTNAQALAKLNSDVAKVTGAPENFLSARLSDKTRIAPSSTLYIGIDDGRLYKVTTKSEDTDVTVTYSGFNTTSIDKTPTTKSVKWGDSLDADLPASTQSQTVEKPSTI